MSKFKAVYNGKEYPIPTRKNTQATLKQTSRYGFIAIMNDVGMGDKKEVCIEFSLHSIDGKNVVFNYRGTRTILDKPHIVKMGSKEITYTKRDEVTILYPNNNPVFYSSEDSESDNSDEK